MCMGDGIKKSTCGKTQKYIKEQTSNNTTGIKCQNKKTKDPKNHQQI